MNTFEIISWLIQYSIQIALLLGICLPLPRVMGIRHPETRLNFYYVLMIVVLCLPLLPSFGSPIAQLAGIPEISFETTISADPGSFLTLDSVLIAGLLWILGTVTGARFLRIGIGFLALNSYARHSTNWHFNSLNAIQKQTFGDQQPKVQIGLSDSVDSPLSFGWKNPRILLPYFVTEIAPEQLESIIRHELIHIRRNDWPLVLFEQMVKSVFWFHPLVRVLIDRIDLSREQVVDREVVRETGQKKKYLRTLYTIASAFRQTSVVPMIPFIREGHLKQRVAQLKQEVVMSKSRRFVLLSILCLLAAGAAIASASAFRFSSAFPPAAAVASEQQEKGEGKSPEGSVQIMDESDVKIQLVKRVNPPYPEEARKQGITGKVVLKIKIGKDGKVVDVEIDESAHELLDNAAVEAVKKWEYTPPVLDGKPVEVLASVNIVFKLK